MFKQKFLFILLLLLGPTFGARAAQLQSCELWLTKSPAPSEAPKLEQAGKADLAQMETFIVEMRAAMQIPNPELSATGEPVTQALRKVLAAGFPGRFFVARLQNQIVGTVGFTRGEGSSVCELKNLYVRPRQEGRLIDRPAGFGHTLLQLAIDQAKADGCTEMHIQTRSSMTKAIKLYIEAGFKVIPSDQSQVPGASDQVIWFVKKLIE